MIKNTKLIQVLIVFLACALAVALYFAPGRKQSLKSSKSTQVDSPLLIEEIITSAKQELKPNQLSKIANWELALASANDSNLLAYYDSLSNGWNFYDNSYLGGYYLKQKIILAPDLKSYLRGGRMFFNAYETLNDSSLKYLSLNEATDLFEKARELEPANDTITLELALCYIENPANPMQGISLLRKLVEENPTNESAIFNLGILSIRSGQFEKAILRFEQILEFAPERFELYRYIGYCYEQIGEKDKAIVYFSRFKSKVNDETLRNEIDRYIKKLKEE